MSYRTITVFLTAPDSGAARLDAAEALCRRMDAHLDVIAIGVDDAQVGYYFAASDAAFQMQAIDEARQRGAAAAEQVEERLRASDVRWSVRAMVAQPGALGDLVAATARYADLVVAAGPHADDARREDETILEAALFPARAPVLIVPPQGLAPDFPRRAVIGWNEGGEALAASRAALPFLTLCDKVSVAVVDPRPRAGDEGEPGQMLSRFLDRHGVRTEVAALARTRPRVADMLFQHARDIDADLMVAGAYGHSRLRQSILGGATRQLLSEATLPLLMAH